MADFGGLRGILQAAAAIDEENKRREAEPVACPRCGTPLDVRDGIRNCPMGHYRIGG
jgi:hypothetical protein